MTCRTSRKTVTFTRPFTLNGVDEVLPAGSYTVETEEASLESVSRLAWRRVSTLLYLPAKRGSAIVTEVVAIDADELDKALERDRACAGLPDGGDTP